jgi:hypothetical protein
MKKNAPQEEERGNRKKEVAAIYLTDKLSGNKRRLSSQLKVINCTRKFHIFFFAPSGRSSLRKAQAQAHVPRDSVHDEWQYNCLASLTLHLQSRDTVHHLPRTKLMSLSARYL